jgi:hypothetical protein
MSSPVDPGVQPVKAADPKSTADSKTPESPKKTPLQSQIKPVPRDEKERRLCKPDSAPLWKIILEVGAVVVGLYVAWVYHGQLNEMIESNRISRESLESIQRAFVTFKNISYARISLKDDAGPAPGKHYWTFRPVVENSGTTPAIEAMSTSSVNIGKHEPRDSDFEGHTEIGHQIAIGPKATFLIDAKPISEELVLRRNYGDNPRPQPMIRYSGPSLYVWGWVFYRDIFKKTPWHLTEFCQGLTVVNVTKDKTLLPQFSDCDAHNCTDEHCPNYQKMVTEVQK